MRTYAVRIRLRWLVEAETSDEANQIGNMIFSRCLVGVAQKRDAHVLGPMGAHELEIFEIRDAASDTGDFFGGNEE